MKKLTRSQARDAAFTQVFQMNMHEDDMDVILEELLNSKQKARQSFSLSVTDVRKSSQAR